MTMNILWITNNILPELAENQNLPTSASGSWLIDVSQRISAEKNINLAVAAVGGTEYKKIRINNITYYLLPGTGKNMLFYTKQYEKLWKQIKDDFKVDIVHLHGTEYSHGLSFLRANPDVKSVVSVQGIISRIKDVFFDGLPKFFGLRYTTFSEIIKLNNIYAKYLLYRYNTRYEKEIFDRVKYANTVNFWDTSMTKAFNPQIQCFNIEYNLREAFYTSEKWDIKRAKRHRIFTNPGGEPIKGIHILCKALSIVKNVYPDVELVVPGMGNADKKLLIKDGYGKYIAELLKKYNIENNVVFTGRLTEDEMRVNMLQAHAVVVPSAIEGTSLILREAMYIGVPCIASFRGGMADFIRDKENGFLYDYSEYTYLAHRIIQIFGDDKLAADFSHNAILQAEKAHDRKCNTENYINMYKYIYYHG